MLKIKDLKVGDIIKYKDSDGYSPMGKDTYSVLENHGTYIVALSDDESAHLISAKELERIDYTLVTPEWKAGDLKKGQNYYYINNVGIVTTSYWNNDSSDIFRLKAGLIYQTEELAQKAINEINNR